MSIPTWEEANKALRSGRPNPLEIFIYYYEPSDYEEAAMFRAGLQHVMDGITHIYSIDKIHQPKG